MDKIHGHEFCIKFIDKNIAKMVKQMDILVNNISDKGLYLQHVKDICSSRKSI